MNLMSEVSAALTEILDIEESSIAQDSYLIRDLGAESIDLLELSVELNKRTGTEIVDDHIFMRRLREHLIDVDSTHHDPEALLMEKYPFLSRKRVKDIFSDLDGGPVLKVQDLVSYLSWRNAHGS